MKKNLMFTALSLTFAQVAFAEAVDEARTLDEVQVTASRREESTLEVPQAVTVLSKAALKKRSGQTNADLLRGEVGTFVQQTTPGQAVIIVRGLKGSEVLHLVDGFRLNNAFFRNAPNQYPALVDPLMVEQIEVVRGPSSVLYGSDAMGGVVQMLSPAPIYSDGEWDAKGSVRTRFASADNSSISRADLVLANNQFYLQAGTTYQDVNLLSTGGNSSVLPATAYTARFADAKFGWLLSETQSLIFGAQFARQPRTPRYDELVPGFGQSNPTSAEFFFRPQERYFSQLQYRLDLQTRVFDSVNISLGQQIIVDDRLNRDFGSSNRDIEKNDSVLNGLTAQFEKSVGEHFLTYGVERYEDTVHSERSRINVNSNAISARPSRYPDGSTLNSSGIYLSDDWRYSERLDFIAGLRYSQIDVVLPPVINAIGVNIDASKTTGHLGFNFALVEGINLVGNYGRGFRAPNVFDLGTFGTRPGNRFNIPNANLKPETVDSIDLGLKFSQGSWTGELIAYQSRYNDKITPVETGERTASSQVIVQNQNATRLDLHGLEAGLRFANDSALSAYASATLTRGTEKLGALQYDADRIPPVFGKLGFDYQINEAWSVGGYSYFAAKQERLSPRDLTDPRINPNGTAGFATTNLSATWNVRPDLDLRFSAENLGDKKYREHGTGLNEAGRSIGVAIDWRWD
jgi:hemoglobin/transferrin/lactoferrin receptor protein